MYKNSAFILRVNWKSRNVKLKYAIKSPTCHKREHSAAPEHQLVMSEKATRSFAPEEKQRALCSTFQLQLKDALPVFPFTQQCPPIRLDSSYEMDSGCAHSTGGYAPCKFLADARFTGFALNAVWAAGMRVGNVRVHIGESPGNTSAASSRKRVPELVLASNQRTKQRRVMRRLNVGQGSDSCTPGSLCGR